MQKSTKKTRKLEKPHLFADNAGNPLTDSPMRPAGPPASLTEFAGHRAGVLAALAGYFEGKTHRTPKTGHSAKAKGFTRSRSSYRSSGKRRRFSTSEL